MNILFKTLLKASERAGHKYYKRVPKKTGKGFDYYYTKAEWQEHQKERKGFLSGIMEYFGFKDEKRTKEKIQEDYNKHEIKEKFDISVKTWTEHLAEYFIHKEKWQTFFKREKKITGGGKKTTGGGKKTTGGKERQTPKIKLSIMKFINEIYSAPVPKVEEPEKKKRKQKIEIGTELTDKEKEEIKENEKIAAREGYYNEKPSEILNVGSDVWGAARHRFDTYEKFNVDFNQMEKDGTAAAYVTKQNLLGDYGLANKDERVKAGETEYKVLASFLVRDILPNVPKNNEEARARYVDFCRAITRLDQETTNATDFLTGLSTIFGTTYGILEKKADEIELDRVTKSKAQEMVGFPLYNILTQILGYQWRYDIYGMDKTDSKHYKILNTLLGSEREPDHAVAYQTILKDLFGAIKASGLKIKKGDNIILTDTVKERVCKKTSDYTSPEDGKLYRELSIQQRELINFEYSLERHYFNKNSIPPTKGEEYILEQELQNSKGESKSFKDHIVIESIDNEYIHYKIKDSDDSGMIKITTFMDNQRNYNVKPIKVDETKKENVLKVFNEYFKTDFKNNEDANKHIEQLKNEIQNKKDKLVVITKQYPADKGQVVKVSKDYITVAFKFPPDNRVRTFDLKPDEIKTEDVESIKRGFTSEGISRVDLLVEAQVKRIGGKNYNDIKVGDAQKILAEQYKFKALQYGNSMPATERQYHTQWTLQSFSDLSEILNLPIEQVTVNGKLGIAFGARGHGKIGGISAIAHYESGTKMINLTRSNGFGSLAHEWGHFLDNILSPNMQDWISLKPTYTQFTTNTPNSGLLHGSIAERQLRHGKIERYFYDSKAKTPGYPWAKLKTGQIEPDEYSTYHAFYNNAKTVLIPEDGKPFEKLAREIASESRNSLHKQTKAFIKDNPGDAEYYRKAILDSDYWNSRNECFARAFEAYVADKLEDNGRMNTYLSSKEKTQSLSAKMVYPQGEHRKTINLLFDEFFNALRGSEDLKKAIIRVGNKIFLYRQNVTR